jgi:hypothetical protein
MEQVNQGETAPETSRGDKILAWKFDWELALKEEIEAKLRAKVKRKRIEREIMEKIYGESRVQLNKQAYGNRTEKQQITQPLVQPLLHRA